MRTHITGIDHGVILVDNLDDGQARYERLGFTVMPRGLHSARLGTANHTIMLERDYLELLGVVTPTAHNEVHRNNLAKGQGLHALALTMDDADAAAVELGGRGIETAPPVSFSRPVRMPDGSAAEAAFRILRLAPNVTPHGDMFLCEHRTRDAVWVPGSTAHANTAMAIAAIVIEVAAPEAAATRYRALLADGTATAIPGGAALVSPTARLEFVTSAAIADRYSAIDMRGLAQGWFKALRIRIHDAAAAKAVLSSTEIKFATMSSGVILIPPSESCGVILELSTDPPAPRPS